MGFYGFGRIRSIHPSVLETTNMAVQDSPDRPCDASAARPARSLHRKLDDMPVLREEVLGVRRAQFPHLPTAVWNHLTGQVRDWLSSLAGRVEKAYEAGIESELPTLLNEGVPQEAYAIGCDVMKTILNQERGFHGSHMVCDVCGQALDFEGDKDRNVTTRLGVVNFRRSYYCCSNQSCDRTVHPLDTLLGIEDHGILPEIQEIVSRETSARPYATAARSIESMLPIHLSKHTAECVTATIAHAVEDVQEHERTQAFADLSHAEFPVPDAPPKGSVAVAAVDGGMCKIRGQDDCREFKLGVLGSLEPAPARADMDKPPPVIDKTYLAHITDADTIFQHLEIEYHRSGLDTCPTLHGLADGAALDPEANQRHGWPQPERHSHPRLLPCGRAPQRRGQCCLSRAYARAVRVVQYRPQPPLGG